MGFFKILVLALTYIYFFGKYDLKLCGYTSILFHHFYKGEQLLWSGLRSTH